LNSTIEERVGKIFSQAYIKNELYEYLVGIGEYKIIFKDSANYDYNDIGLMLRGINAYLSVNPNVNLDDFLEKSLIEYLNSNDLFKISLVLDFVLYYIKYTKKEKMAFEINLDIIIPLLKDKLKSLKQELSDKKIESDKNDSFWQNIQNRCDLYEIRTGNKILWTEEELKEEENE